MNGASAANAALLVAEATVKKRRMSATTISGQDFEAHVLRAELPVLVEFFTPRSEQSKEVAVDVDALALELEGKAKLVRVDIEQNPRLAQMLRIQGVPTFMVFVQGRPAAAERGVVPRAKLRALLEPFLPRAEGAIKPEELALLMKESGAVAVDTRDAGSFGRAHIPGGVHMPYEEIETRLAELHMLGMPVLYCRTGAVTKELSEKLARDGIGVPFLEGGFLAWEAEFLPIERD